jgi:hypothetical protein
MKNELTEIERLDLVARAEAIEPFVSRAALPMAFVTALIFLLALASDTSFKETLAIWTFSCLAASTAFMLWRHWCYAIYGLSILNFFAAFGCLKDFTTASPGPLLVLSRMNTYLFGFS